MTRIMVFKYRINCILLIILIMASCKGQPKKNPDMDLKTQNAYIKFQDQEHRLELNECEMDYNGTRLELKQPIANWKKVLGTNFEMIEEEDKVTNETYQFYFWNEIGISAFVKKGLVLRLAIYLSLDSLSYLFPNVKKLPNHIFFINETAIQKGIKMQNFVDHNQLDYGNFNNVADSGYDIIYSNCLNYPSQDLSYFFVSKIDYEYKDYGGHINLKGDAIHGKNKIEMISISVEEKE